MSRISGYTLSHLQRLIECLGTVVVRQRIAHVLVVRGIFRQLSLQFRILHHSQVGDIAMHLERIGYAHIVVLLSQIRSIDSQILPLEILHDSLGNLLAGLQVVLGFTFLVINGHHSQ